jgi:hypothetical protein
MDVPDVEEHAAQAQPAPEREPSPTEVDQLGLF